MRCGEEFVGPFAVRFMHGRIEYNDPKKPNDPKFTKLKFEDNTKLKWLCPPCAAEHQFIVDACCFRPHSVLSGMTDGWCCLCSQPIQPFPIKDYGSAISVELGHMAVGELSGVEQFRPFIDPGYHGHLDWGCIYTHLGLDLNRLIEPDDGPDPDAEPDPNDEDFEMPEYQQCGGCGECDFCQFLLETGEFDEYFEWERENAAGEG
jgi:hypothetical protein